MRAMSAASGRGEKRIGTLASEDVQAEVHFVLV